MPAGLHPGATSCHEQRTVERKRNYCGPTYSGQSIHLLVAMSERGYGSFRTYQTSDIVSSPAQQRGCLRTYDEHPIVLLNKILSLAQLHGIKPNALSFVSQFC